MLTTSDREDKFIEIMVYLEEFAKNLGAKGLKANSTLYSASVFGTSPAGNTFSVIAIAKIMGDGTYDVALRPESVYTPKCDSSEAREFAQKVINSVEEAVKEIVAR